MGVTARFCLGFLLIGLFWGCSGGSPEPTTIRLLDEFDSGRVEGGSNQPAENSAPTEWRFDESTAVADSQWKAGPGIAGFSAGNGLLKARSTTDIPILHVERTSGLDNLDVLHAVEVRLRGRGVRPANVQGQAVEAIADGDARPRGEVTRERTGVGVDVLVAPWGRRRHSDRSPIRGGRQSATLGV